MIIFPARLKSACRSLAWMVLLAAYLRAADTTRSQFLPVLASDSSGFLGLSLVNTASVANELTVTWTDPEGRDFRTASLTLQPGAQRALLAREILGLPLDPEGGWIRIDASAGGLFSYLTFGMESKLDGTEPVLQPAPAVVFDGIRVNTGFVELDYADSLVVLVNPGASAANARIELSALDGRTAGILPVFIPARGSRALRISESFRDLLPANNPGGRKFDGYAKVFSDEPLAGWLRNDTPLSVRLIRGRAISEIEPASLVVAGHFASGGASLYRSTLNLINLGDAPAKLELVAQDDRGKTIGESVNLSLNPGQGIRDDVLTLFRVIQPAIFPPPLLTGYIRIRAAGGSLFRSVGNMDIHSDRNVVAALFPLAAVTSREWMLPFAVSGKDYYTGYVIVNPNELLTVQTDVTVELLDAEGHLATAPLRISLSPSARFSGLVNKEISYGSMRIRANLPVIVLGSIGTCNGSTLAYLTALPY